MAAAPPRRLALNLSMVFTELPLLDRFAAAAGLGFRGVELQFPYDVPATALAAAARAADVKVVLINVPAGDLMTGGPGLAGCPGRESDYGEALSLCADYVDAVRPACVNVLAGRQSPDAARETCLATFRANLALTRERLAPTGATTVFEAINTHDLPGSLMDGTAAQRAVLDALGGPGLKLQFDIYHMTRMGEDVNGFLRTHGDCIGHIQFADVPGRGEPGSGAVDFATLLATIDASDYRGWLAAEYRPTGVSADSFGWLELPPFGPPAA